MSTPSMTSYLIKDACSTLQMVTGPDTLIARRDPVNVAQTRPGTEAATVMAERLAMLVRFLHRGTTLAWPVTDDRGREVTETLHNVAAAWQSAAGTLDAAAVLLAQARDEAAHVHERYTLRGPGRNRGLRPVALDVDAIPAGPFIVEPYDLYRALRDRPDQDATDAVTAWLVAVLDRAGVTLDAHDRLVVAVLPFKALSLVQTVAGWVTRANHNAPVPALAQPEAAPDRDDTSPADQPPEVPA